MTQTAGKVNSWFIPEDILNPAWASSAYVLPRMIQLVEMAEYEALERERDALIEELVTTKSYLMKERDELMATIDELNKKYSHEKIVTKAIELEKQNAELRAALKVYADIDKLNGYEGKDYPAREALAKAEGRSE